MTRRLARSKLCVNRGRLGENHVCRLDVKAAQWPQGMMAADGVYDVTKTFQPLGNLKTASDACVRACRTLDAAVRSCRFGPDDIWFDGIRNEAPTPSEYKMVGAQKGATDDIGTNAERKRKQRTRETTLHRTKTLHTPASSTCGQTRLAWAPSAGSDKRPVATPEAKAVPGWELPLGFRQSGLTGSDASGNRVL